MSLLGVHLTVLIGPSVPVPAPPSLLESLERVEVIHSDEGPSGFSLSLRVGRQSASDLLDFALMSDPLLKVMSRVILTATFNATPRVLMDGIVTNQQLAPSHEPGRSTLTLTGEDISVLMDLEEKSVEHPAQDETVIATKIIASYAQYGLVPVVVPPLAVDPPIPIERVPVQQATDRGYLNEIAGRHSYVFYVTPGPAPLASVAYWGPPVRVGVPQRALSVNMGGETNVDAISFRNDALGPTTVSRQVQDRSTNETVPVQALASLRPPLAAFPAWLFNQPNVRSTKLRDSGLNASQAMAMAQGVTDSSVDAVTADGQLDAMRYGDLLRARSLVGLRGVGYSYDGLWYTKKVKHVIEKDKYTQSFTLAREGLGSTTPVVMP